MACAAAVRVCPGRGIGTSSAQARRWSAQAFKPWSLRRPQMTIVMGLDQHRAQITTEWVDTETGEIGRARAVTPPLRPQARVRYDPHDGAAFVGTRSLRPIQRGRDYDHRP